MNYKILLFMASTSVVSFASYYIVSSFEFYSFATLFCGLMIAACIALMSLKLKNKIHNINPSKLSAVIKRKIGNLKKVVLTDKEYRLVKNYPDLEVLLVNTSNIRFLWVCVATCLGTLVVLGLTNEWYSNLQLIFQTNNYLLLAFSCLAGFAFFSMLASKEKELFSILKNQGSMKMNQKSLLTGASLFLNIVFWLVLIMAFNLVPWYLHLTLAVVSSLLTFWVGYMDSKDWRDGLDKILLFCTMFAHFCAESAISGVGVPRMFSPFVALAHFFSEAACDLGALVENKHGHKHKHKKSFWLIFAFAFATCSVVLGYFEIPKALLLIGVNPNSSFAVCFLLTILVFGGISCFSVNFNCIAGGDHEHLKLQPFKNFAKVTLPKFNLRKISKAFVSFFGAVLNSTVGVILAAEVFSLPVWLMFTLVILAFITEFAFHYCNQSILTESHSVPCGNFDSKGGCKHSGETSSGLVGGHSCAFH